MSTQASSFSLMSLSTCNRQSSFSKFWSTRALAFEFIDRVSCRVFRNSLDSSWLPSTRKIRQNQSQPTLESDEWDLILRTLRRAAVLQLNQHFLSSHPIWKKNKDDETLKSTLMEVIQDGDKESDCWIEFYWKTSFTTKKINKSLLK